MFEAAAAALRGCVAEMDVGSDEVGELFDALVERVVEEADTEDVMVLVE